MLFSVDPSLLLLMLLTLFYMVKRPNFACAASGGVISCSGDSPERPKGVSLLHPDGHTDGINATLQRSVLASAELFC